MGINVGSRREGGITCTCTVLYDNCVDGLFCAQVRVCGGN